MSKKIIFILAIFICIASFGQNQKATLYFRDGTIIEGLIKFTLFEDQIKFRKNKKSEKIIYDYKVLKKFETTEEGESVEYHYKINKSSRYITYPLVKLVEKGKKSLYSKQGWVYSAPMGPSGGVGQSYPVTIHYISDNESDFIYNISSKKVFRGKFKKAGAEYFKDCQSLSEKISSKELKYTDIVEIIKYYNENCGNKSEVEENSESTNTEIKN